MSNKKKWMDGSEQVLCEDILNVIDRWFDNQPGGPQRTVKIIAALSMALGGVVGSGARNDMREETIEFSMKIIRQNADLIGGTL